MFENLGCASIGVAIRDSAGEVIATLSQRIHLPHLVEMIKAMAARRAIIFAQDLSLSTIVVEDDCLRDVTTLNASVCCNTMYGNVVEETRRQGCQHQHC